jgi:phosphohistidine phosphatase SixA
MKQHRLTDIASRRRGGVGVMSVIVLVVLLLAAGAIAVAFAARQREKVGKIRCLATIRALGQASALYSETFNGAMPPTLKMIRRQLRGRSASFDCATPSDASFAKSIPAFDCPVGGNTIADHTRIIDPDLSSDYTYAMAGYREKDKLPASVLFYEQVGNHPKTTAILFGDRSARVVPSADAKSMIAGVQSGQNPLSKDGEKQRAKLIETGGQRAEMVMQTRPCVVLMRHAVTTPGDGDPVEFNLNDRATQRNLSDVGEQQARNIGAYFAEKGIVFDVVLTSPWARCNETATLAGLTPTPDAAFGAKAEPKTRAGRFHELMNSKQPQRVLIVTHASVIRALAGHDPAPGEVVVFDRSQFSFLHKTFTTRHLGDLASIKPE